MAEGFIRLSHLDLSPKQLKARRDPKRVTEAIQVTMESIWKESAAVFVSELSKDVLVETGESVGSLIPLARFTQATLTFRSPIKSNVKKPQLNPITGEPVKGTIRSAGSGNAKGEGAFGFEFSKNHYRFTFAIPVFQFFLHDSGLALNSKIGAVNATVRAHAAQRAFVSKEFHRRVGSLVHDWITTGSVRTIGVKL